MFRSKSHYNVGFTSLTGLHNNIRVLVGQEKERRQHSSVADKNNLAFHIILERAGLSASG